MSQTHSAYQILGLTAHASPEEVKAAYRALARQWHPDQFTDAEEKAKAEATFKAITVAYTQLKQAGYQLNHQTDAGSSSQNGGSKTSTAEASATSSTRVNVSQNAAERMRSRAQLLYKQAQDLAEADRFREATDALDQAIRLSDDYLEAYEYRAALYEKRGFERLAHRDFAKARELRRLQRPNPSSRPSTSSSPSSSSGPTASAETDFRAAARKSANRNSTQATSKPSRTPWFSRRQPKPNETPRSAKQEVNRPPGESVQDAPLPFQRPIRLDPGAASQTWVCRDELTGHTGSITAIACLKKNRFVTASQDGSLRLWQFKRNQPSEAIATLTGHRGTVLGLAISPDGQSIASYGEDGSVNLWQGSDGKRSQTFATGPIASLIFGPERNTLTCCDRQGQIRQWSRQTGSAANAAWASRASTYLALSQNGKCLLTRLAASNAEGLPDHCLRPWSLRPEKALAPLDSSDFEQTAVCLSNDGKYVAAGKRTGQVCLWHVPTGQPTMALAGLSGSIDAIAMNPDRILAAADATSRIWLVDLVTRALLSELSAPALVTQLQFAPDYGQLISGHANGSIRIWHRI